MISPLEALLDAIMAREGWKALPTPTRSYRNRNPGNMRIPGQLADADGFTIFPDLPSGYSAALRDLRDKFTAGMNHHGLGPTSTLLQLMKVWSPADDGNDPDSYSIWVANWLSAALGRPIKPTDTLGSIWQSTPDA